MIVLFVGGGIHSKSLSDMPQNIDNMIKQYNKFAQGTCNIQQNISGIYGGKIDVPFNLKFKPKIVFLEVEIKDYFTWKFCLNNNMGVVHTKIDNDSGDIKVELKDNNHCSFVVKDFQYYHDYMIKKWYAIGE